MLENSGACDWPLPSSANLTQQAFTIIMELGVLAVDYRSTSFKSMKEDADPLFTAIVSDVQRGLGIQDSKDTGS